MAVNLVKIDEVNFNLPTPTVPVELHKPKNKFSSWVSRRILGRTGQYKRISMGVLTTLHYQAIHAIRRFTVDGHLLSESGLEEETESFERLANDCRDAFGISIGQNPKKIHCSIKLYKGTRDIPQGEWTVWTLARSEFLTSEPFTLRNQFGPEAGQKAKENSAYAALTGCSDGKTEWGMQPYSCFCCNDLKKHDKYVNTRKNWPDFYKAGMVFPLRWLKSRKSKIELKGFLSFDTDIHNFFGDVPCIFECQFLDYYRKLIDSIAFHAGGIIADVLATTIALQDKIETKS